MEDALALFQEYWKEKLCWIVLILVVMEDALAQS